MRMCVCLRDRAASSCTILLEVRANDDEDREEGDEPSHEEMFQKFTAGVREMAPRIVSEDVDVYVGIWGTTFSFDVPKELLHILGERGWGPITFSVS